MRAGVVCGAPIPGSSSSNPCTARIPERSSSPSHSLHRSCELAALLGEAKEVAFPLTTPSTSHHQRSARACLLPPTPFLGPPPNSPTQGMSPPACAPSARAMTRMCRCAAGYGFWLWIKCPALLGAQCLMNACTAWPACLLACAVCVLPHTRTTSQHAHPHPTRSNHTLIASFHGVASNHARGLRHHVRTHILHHATGTESSGPAAQAWPLG